MPRSPGHAFYDRLQGVLIGAGFDAFAEATCKPYYASKMGAPSIPPGRYFRMHMVGYFEGIDSERGIEWRCADSLSLREFLRLETTARVPDHSWLSRTRSRLPAEVHEHVFAWVLKLIAARGLVKGERIGVDASTMEANAALRTIVRRDTGETYREMLKRMAKESGIETPSAEDLMRLDRARKGKKLSNEDWVSATDAEAKIARMKDGTTHLSYKPASAVDLDTGVVGDRRARVAGGRKIEVAIEPQIAVVIGEEEFPPGLSRHPPACGKRRHLTGEMRDKGGRDGFHGMILPPCVGDV
jgi:transposase